MLQQQGCILQRHGGRHDIYLNPATGQENNQCLATTRLITFLVGHDPLKYPGADLKPKS